MIVVDGISALLTSSYLCIDSAARLQFFVDPCKIPLFLYNTFEILDNFVRPFKLSFEDYIVLSKVFTNHI